jgi:hypothetical protein
MIDYKIEFIEIDNLTFLIASTQSPVNNCRCRGLLFFN